MMHTSLLRYAVHQHQLEDFSPRLRGIVWGARGGNLSYISTLKYGVLGPRLLTGMQGVEVLLF